MDEQVCPQCKRVGTVIVGVKSIKGGIRPILQCRVCKYSWTESEAAST